MRAALLVVLLAASAAQAQDFRLHVGGQVGFPFIAGVTSVGTFFKDGRPRFDVDVAWEPSVTLQSYSVGAAYHVLDRAFFVGGRIRAVEFQAPWARGGAEPYLGLGLELGGRFRVGEGDRGVIHVALHGTFVPGMPNNLMTLVGLSAGFSWSVFER